MKATLRGTLRIWTFSLQAAAVLSLTACSEGTSATAGHTPSDNSTSPGSATPSPPIHYDQTAVLTLEGEPSEQRSYRKLLADCQKAGGAIRALTSDEEAKVGREHVEAWIGPDKRAQHDERWGFEDSPPCHFSLSHVMDVTEIDDANGRATIIDGVTGKVEVQELGKPTPAEALPNGDGELTAAERQSGYSKQSNATANGAQCAVWQDSRGEELCVWTGGRKWGYSADGAGALKDGLSHDSSIVLWAHPGQGPGWKLETKEFSVGAALDPRAFAIPKVATRGVSP